MAVGRVYPSTSRAPAGPTGRGRGGDGPDEGADVSGSAGARRAARSAADGPLTSSGGSSPARDDVSAIDLVVVGAATRDLVPDDPRGWRIGGAATYTSLTAARLGLRVAAVMGVDAAASEAAELGILEAAGVRICRVALASGPVFENLEVAGHRVQHVRSVSDRVPVSALPEGWRAARGWLLAPVAGEIGDDWAAVPQPEARVGLGWQGLLRAFTPDGGVLRVPPTPRPLLEVADLVVASVEDLRPETTLAALAGLLRRDSTLVLTAGSRGGYVASQGALRRYPAVPTSALLDPTGAGDVFLASLMAAWLLAGYGPASPRALRLAAAVASCSVEGVGLHGVPSREEVSRRLASGPARRSAPGSPRPPSDEVSRAS